VKARASDHSATRLSVDGNRLGSQGVNLVTTVLSPPAARRPLAPPAAAAVRYRSARARYSRRRRVVDNLSVDKPSAGQVCGMSVPPFQ